MFKCNCSIIFCLFFCVVTACENNNNDPIDPGNDPNFTIVAHDDEGLANKSNRKVNVWGIDIYAADKVEDEKLLHAANIMAQYLDNDEDGVVDNELVLDNMLENEAFLFLWNKQRDFPNNVPEERIGQDLGNDETRPEWHTNGQTGQFDASLEEVWHIISTAGHAYAYPDIFAESANTALTDAMDIARGGYFEEIPNPYPNGAWYTYDDQTCDYGCMVAEYFYWAMTSLLGAQANRLDEIQQEWDLNTPELLESTDQVVYELLTNPEYKLPMVLPDGTYRH